MSLDAAKAFFERHRDLEVVEAFVADVNGVPRGKWVPSEAAAKILAGELRLPRSTFALDIWGSDVNDAGLVVETGDSDGVCLPVPSSLARIPWLARPTAQILLTMTNPDGTAFLGDPRQVLTRVVEGFHAHGLTPVVATELEFYLVDREPDECGRPQPPLSPLSGRRQWAPDVYSIDEMHAFQTVLGALGDACAAQGIPADTTICENGPAQFEINLNHVDNAMVAADQALFMKRAVKGVARRSGMDATFMAKPYGHRSGNGLHCHFSVVDADGKNIFAGADSRGSARLRHAIGGCLQTMPDAMAILSANANSYRRFQRGSHAPTTASWGYDNRSSALRVPDSPIAATRIEHRVAGADANPYLVLAAILAGALHGIVNELEPGDAVEGDAYSSAASALPTGWADALSVFERSAFINEYLGSMQQRLYTACKRQEMDELARRVSDIEYEAYLRSV
jgi:glutamine synthetase